MINVDVVVENSQWGAKIKNPQFYLKKKLEKMHYLFPQKKIFFFSILLTNNSKMKYFNKKFRKKNEITDVLSFPFWSPKELKKIRNKKIYLGDIALSYEIINKRSKKTNFDSEFDKMWIHGYLHLLGYHHKKNSDYEKMKKVEDKILALCSQNF